MTDAGDGDGGEEGQIITTNHKQIQKQIVRTFFALLGHFRKMQNNFKICSYIQKMTPNPINTLEITIYNTKHATNTQIHLQTSKKNKESQIHISK